jgi:hypothetical protein
MRLGDHVIWADRVYVLRGVEPMSVPDGRAELTDTGSGERIFVPANELTPAPSSPHRLREADGLASSRRSPVWETSTSDRVAFATSQRALPVTSLRSSRIAGEA